MVKRLLRTLKEQCFHCHRFESQQYAMRVIGDWIQFYNHWRPHQALNMRIPAEAYALTDWPLREPVGYYTGAFPEVL